MVLRTAANTVAPCVIPCLSLDHLKIPQIPTSNTPPSLAPHWIGAIKWKQKISHLLPIDTEYYIHRILHE